MKTSISLPIFVFLMVVGLCGVADGAICIGVHGTSECGAVHLTWTNTCDLPGFTLDHYHVYRHTQFSSHTIIAEIAGSSIPEYDDTSAVSGTTYYYDIAAVYSVGGVGGIERSWSGMSSGLTPSVCAPEFPSMFLPVAMVTGLLGTVLLIQRTREQ